MKCIANLPTSSGSSVQPLDVREQSARWVEQFPVGVDPFCCELVVPLVFEVAVTGFGGE
jgi:hypothetical protein